MELKNKMKISLFNTNGKKRCTTTKSLIQTRVLLSLTRIVANNFIFLQRPFTYSISTCCNAPYSMHAKQQKNMPTCKELVQEFTTIANTPTRTNKQIEPQTKPVQTPNTQNTINPPISYFHSERRSITQASNVCRGNITRVSPRYQSKSEPRTLRQPSPHPRHARLPGPFKSGNADGWMYRPSLGRSSRIHHDLDERSCL
jgi:hypothetical protein